jgi:sporulation protein YlmC with PRC-barrel domain
MKLKSIHLISGALAVAFSLTQTYGAPPPSRELPPVVIQGNSPAGATGEVTTPRQSFAELIDAEVLNFQNEKLGKIKAVTVDLENGRLVEVLVSTRSGMLGMNETITPVPPTLVKMDSRRAIARINVSKARFDAAAKLPKMNVASYSQKERAVAASRYFGVEPWFSGVSQLGFVQTNTTIELMQIKNMQGRYMGKVGILMMDLPTARIRQVVADMDSMNEGGSRILPVGSIHYNAKHDGLMLDRSFAELNNEAHFRWAHGNGGDTEYVEEVNAGRKPANGKQSSAQAE